MSAMWFDSQSSNPLLAHGGPKIESFLNTHPISTHGMAEVNWNKIFSDNAQKQSFTQSDKEMFTNTMSPSDLVDRNN